MKGGAANKIYHLTFYVEGRQLVVTDPVTAFMYPVPFEVRTGGEKALRAIRRAIDAGRKMKRMQEVFDIDHVSMMDD